MWSLPPCFCGQNMLDRLISTSQKGDICFNSSNISVGKIHANISLFQQNHHTLLFKKLTHQQIHPVKKKRENCMRAGRRQGGGVEQLHAIAQNHSTIILPSHKSPNNTETLLAIFKTTQKRFLQMVGKTKNLQVVFIFSS